MERSTLGGSLAAMAGAAVLLLAPLVGGIGFAGYLFSRDWPGEPVARLTARPGDGQVTLTWEATGADVDDGVDWVYKQRHTDDIRADAWTHWKGIPEADECSEAGASRCWVVRNLTNGVGYTFRVGLRRAEGPPLPALSFLTPPAERYVPSNRASAVPWGLEQRLAEMSFGIEARLSGLSSAFGEELDQLQQRSLDLEQMILAGLQDEFCQDAPEHLGVVDFEIDRSEIARPQRLQLGEIIEKLKQPSRSRWLVVVEGHASADGAQGHNADLSEERAEAVVTELERQVHGLRMDLLDIRSVSLGERPGLAAGDRRNVRNRRAVVWRCQPRGGRVPAR